MIICVQGSSEPLYRCYGARTSPARTPCPKVFMCVALSLNWKSGNRSGLAHAIGVSFSGDIQDPPGQGPVQPAVGDPASAGGLD